jgi:hypothetical protein
MHARDMLKIFSTLASAIMRADPQDRDSDSDPVGENLEPVVMDSDPVVADSDPVVGDSDPVVADSDPVVENLEPAVVELDTSQFILTKLTKPIALHNYIIYCPACDVINHRKLRTPALK